MASPGVVADSNGFFHPLGDHAQTSFSIDGQPIADQQSKQFSTQIPLNAIQSMELITGAPGAEFGDKTSLVVNAVTRSGLGQKPFGSFAAQYGSFGAIGEEATLGLGGKKFGNFLSANALRSGRFLDTPEFRPFHDVGNSQTIFDRLDWQPAARRRFSPQPAGRPQLVPGAQHLDQPDQDQRQKVLTYNIAPGYQHTFGAGALLTVNVFLRRDQVYYDPSRDPFADTPATVGEYRSLANYGVRADYNYVHKIHNVKVGTQLMQTRLHERFSLGITEPGFTDDQPGLVPYDLTAGGSPVPLHRPGQRERVRLLPQDTITLGHFTFTPGVRIDRYDGLSQATAVEPRLGASYLLKPTGTVLRAAYSRTLETPYNENLILSSSTGAGGLATNLFGAFERARSNRAAAISTTWGCSNRSSRYLQLDADYFWKFTNNAFDFGTLLNTPLVFPISWQKSKIDGVSLAPQHHSDSRRAGLHDHGAHPVALLRPFQRRPAVQLAAGYLGLPHRSRPGLSANHAPDLPAPAQRPLGRLHLAVRFRPGGRRGGQPRRRARPDGSPTSRHRLLLRQPVRHSGQPDRRVRVAELRRDPAGHPGRRNGRRRPQSAAHRAAAPLRPGSRYGQPVPHRTRPHHLEADGHQPDQSRGALQLPFHLQRHALRLPARLPDGVGLDVVSARSGV